MEELPSLQGYLWLRGVNVQGLGCITCVNEGSPRFFADFIFIECISLLKERSGVK